MWYFTWILGVLLACSFGIINALWLENSENMDCLGADNSADGEDNAAN